MQALRRRYQQAQQRVSRRQSRYNAKRTAAAARVLERKTVLRNDTRRYNIGIDRQQRWEEWFLGPLRTGGEAGVGKDGKGAGELLVRKDLSPELKFNHQDTRLLKKMADKVATKKRKRHKIVKAKLSVPRKADVGPENFVVVSLRASHPNYLYFQSEMYAISQVVPKGCVNGDISYDNQTAWLTGNLLTRQVTELL